MRSASLKYSSLLCHWPRVGEQTRRAGFDLLRVTGRVAFDH
jgi:hypothetical protein